MNPFPTDPRVWCDVTTQAPPKAWEVIVGGIVSGVCMAILLWAF